MKDELRSLPPKKAKLEETKRLLERLEAREGEVSADRYERLSERYRSKITVLEEEVSELTDEGRAQEMELEDRLAHQREKQREAEAELDELESLHAEGALDDDTYNTQRRRYRREAKQAKKKARAQEKELDEVRFYLTEVGDVSYRREKIQGQMTAASSQAQQWGKEARERLSKWSAGATVPQTRLLGGGLAVLVLLAVVWMLWPSGQTEEAAMFGGGPARTGLYAGSGPKEKPNVKWSFETRGEVHSSPAVSRGIVYVGSTDHNLSALNVETGEEQWSFETEGGIRSSPAVSDGSVYVGSNDGNLYAVDAESGEERWSFETGNEVISSPAVSDGSVYVGSNDGNLYAVDAESGEERWSFETGNEVISSPAVSDGSVYVGSNDGNLYAVDAESGEERWSFETGNEVVSSPAVSDGIVYVGNNGRYVSNSEENVYAVDVKTGKKRWGFETESDVSASPAVANGIVYVGSSDNNLYAVDTETGEEQWRFEANGRIGASPAISDGVIYISSSDGNIYALGVETGEEQWRFEIGGGGSRSSPSSPVVGSRTIYIGNRDRRLYALQGKNREDESAEEENEGIDNDLIKEQVTDYLSNYVERRALTTMRFVVELSEYVEVERVDITEESISGNAATVICKIRFEPKRSLGGDTPAGNMLQDVLGQRGVREGQTIINELEFTFTKTDSGWEFDERHQTVE